MGRWRAPRPAAAPYITRAGFLALQQELQDCWSQRAGVVSALAAAAAEGDRSENAEYIYRKKELAGIDRRIRYLQKRLPDLRIVERTEPTAQVFFGARVVLARDDGSRVEYRIVGPDETHLGGDCISIDAPLARALLKKQAGDEIHLDTGAGGEMLQLLAVSYEID